MSKKTGIIHFTLFSILHFFISLSYSQSNKGIRVISFDKCPVNTINLDSLRNLVTSNSKITIVIFRSENTMGSRSTISTLSEHLSNIDTSLFDIYSFELTKCMSASGCFKYILNKKQTEEGGSPIDIHFFSKNVNLLNQLLKLHKSIVMDKLDNTVANPRRVSEDSVGYILLNEILNPLNCELLKQRIEIEKLQIELLTIKTKQIANDVKRSFSFIEFQYYYGITGLKTDFSNINISKANTSSFSVNYIKHPISLLPNLGFGVQLEYNSTTLNCKNDFKSIDTINFGYFDNEGEKYKRIIYAEKISEKHHIQTLSIKPNINLSYNLGNKINLILYGGLKYTFFSKAIYSNSEGNISYGALYTHYSNDTLFTGLNENYLNIRASSTNQKFKMVDKSFSIDFAINLRKPIIKEKFYITIGGFYSLGLSNLLNIQNEDKIISYNPTSYNSLLYKMDELKLNTYGFSAGISFKF